MFYSFRMSFTVGKNVRITVFGTSHGRSVNAILEGVPAGFRVDTGEVQRWLSYRRPGFSDLTSPRREEDNVEIVTGLHNGLSDGSPLFFRIENRNVISGHYDDIRFMPRPGHADITMWYKYGENRSYEGGGFLSGRLTAPMVAAGSVCLQLLRKYEIKIISFQRSIGHVHFQADDVPNDPEFCYSFRTRIPSAQQDREAQDLLRKIVKDGDSIGGIIATVVNGIPPGVGEPLFDSIESTISRLMFSIPGLKAIEFGKGFGFAESLGSEVVDSFEIRDGKIVTSSNNNGGILGGISNGMPITFQVAMKPTASIRKPLKTINLKTKEEAYLTVRGRHDPCISIRAVPVVQTMTAVALCDLLSQSGFIPRRIT